MTCPLRLCSGAGADSAGGAHGGGSRGFPGAPRGAGAVGPAGGSRAPGLQPRAGRAGG